MKFFHLSDLHLGLRFREQSLIEDQKYILDEIVSLAEKEKPDGTLIAGDVYDKSVPPAEAVALLDDFLVRLSQICPHIFLISGNHDSAERVAFGGRQMIAKGVHLSPVYTGECAPVVLSDGYGVVNVYLLPFVKPAHVRRAFPEAEIGNDYTAALSLAVEKMHIDRSARNVLVCHQFVTGAARSESEEIVGGLDNVDSSAFDPFDYVALGHIHSPQNVASERIRYCGTPLKYSFSEAGQQKSVTVVELGKKGDLRVRTLPLTPLRETREIRGSYEEVTRRTFYENTDYRDAYMRITLTDEEDIPDAVGKLRAVYKNLLRLDYDNRRTRSEELLSMATDAKQKSAVDLLGELYEKQNGRAMSETQRRFVEEMTKEQEE